MLLSVHLPSFSLIVVHILSKTSYEFPKDEICPVIYTLSLIGQKWKIPILWHLAEDGNLRYGELKKKIFGITNLMLTKNLRELEKDNFIKNELIKLKSNKFKFNIAIIIGPEGGIEEKEIEVLKSSGAKVVSLGKRILRTETVCIQTISIIMYELEN